MAAFPDLLRSDRERRGFTIGQVAWRLGDDDWVKEDVVRSDEDRDPLLAGFVETWGAISDDNTRAMFDPARRN